MLKIVKIGALLGLLGSLITAGGIFAIYRYLEPGLPSTIHLREIKLQVPLRIYSSDNKLIAEFGEKRRIPLRYDEIPQSMLNAFLAAEDDRFFEHPGVDYHGLLRAASQLLLTGQRRQGGSTITMQVARNFFLSREKTYTRKLNEIFLALRIEEQLSKPEILALYLNKIYMGNRAYGVGAAAKVYYGKQVDELTLPQAAMIAGLPKAPSRYNPIVNPKRALIRRDYVLGRMLKLGMISATEHQTALATPVTAKRHSVTSEIEAPYIAEIARTKALEQFGDAAYTGGYTIKTTIDSRLQLAANSAIRDALQAYDLRHGYRGPVQQLNLSQISDEESWDKLLKKQPRVADLRVGLVTTVNADNIELYIGNGEHLTLGWNGLAWARSYESENRQGPKPKLASEILQLGDLIRFIEAKDKEGISYWRLAQIPNVSGALVAVKPESGAIVAMVGGYDFFQSKFNRATQAKRQPGSGFKAFIYSAALENGYTAASLINDAPVVFDDPALEASWRPENYSGKFFGPTRLRYALTKSRNLVSIRLLRAIGTKTALNHAALFGFDISKLPADLSLALGSGAVTPIKMAEGYSVLANGGFHTEPYLIEQISEDHSKILFQANPYRVCDETAPSAETTEERSTEEPLIEPLNCAERVISAQNHYLMNSMMRDVVQAGTARRARVLGRKDIAGKTGTTNDQRDAWFNGFNNRMVAITWLGFDNAKPLGRGEVGGRAALPAWISFMREALQDMPEQPLEMPVGMVTIRINAETGKAAHTGEKNSIFEVFREENLPEMPPPQSEASGTESPAEESAEEDPF
ncbi:MAG: penicillin-binding protein 1A [Candidatus Polarisedimenticolaceae bacterium]|nr:penicillin-binding protein 1A [Candidatus Polarisedimenticolaceae bacterium]